MRIVYHPGTGTYMDAAECMVVDVDEASAELPGADLDEVLSVVDVWGVDLGELLDAVFSVGSVLRGGTVSRFEAKEAPR